MGRMQYLCQILNLFYISKLKNFIVWFGTTKCKKMDEISKILNFFKNKEVLFLLRLPDIM